MKDRTISMSSDELISNEDWGSEEDPDGPEEACVVEEVHIAFHLKEAFGVTGHLKCIPGHPAFFMHLFMK